MAVHPLISLFFSPRDNLKSFIPFNLASDFNRRKLNYRAQRWGWAGILLVWFAVGCANQSTGSGGPTDGGDTALRPGELVSAERIKSFTYTDINTALLFVFGLQPYITTSELQYNLEVFKITYGAEGPDGEIIPATGVVMVPDGNQAFPLLGVSHGTIFTQAESPTSQPFEGAPEAATGMIAFVPDFLGFGDHALDTHPYIFAPAYASAVVYGLKASLDFLADEGVEHNGQLFLKGYSEGGYATMAALKALETEDKYQGIFEGELELTAAAPGAGPYDLVETSRELIGASTLAYPAYLPYVFLSYSESLGLDWPLTDFFKEPYASQIPGLYNKEKTGSEINEVLSDDPATLLTDSFLSGFLGDGQQEVKSVFAEYSLHDWVPATPLKLYHCTEDDTVPFSNSQTAFDNFDAAGSEVELVTSAGGHSDCPLYLAPQNWFAELTQ